MYIYIFQEFYSDYRNSINGDGDYSLVEPKDNYFHSGRDSRKVFMATYTL